MFPLNGRNILVGVSVEGPEHKRVAGREGLIGDINALFLFGPDNDKPGAELFFGWRRTALQFFVPFEIDDHKHIISWEFLGLCDVFPRPNSGVDSFSPEKPPCQRQQLRPRPNGLSNMIPFDGKSSFETRPKIGVLSPPSKPLSSLMSNHLMLYGTKN